MECGGQPTPSLRAESLLLWRITISLCGFIFVLPGLAFVLRGSATVSCIMLPDSIKDSPLREEDSGLVDDEDLELGDKIDNRRAHPYQRPSDVSSKPPFPSQSFSAVIRAEIRNVFAQEDIFEPIVQMRMGLSDLQNQHQESWRTANQMVMDMQRVLSSCHSTQSQMGTQINDSRRRLELNTAQVQQAHMDPQRAEITRSHMTQQISNDQDRLNRMQQQHDQNYARIQCFACQVGNQFQQMSHSDMPMAAPTNGSGWNSDSRPPGYRTESQPRESSFEVYPRPLMVTQSRASGPEMGSFDRQFWNLNTPARAESKSHIPNAKISPVPAFEASRYSNWRREIKFWKDSHEYMPESQLISFLGLNGGLNLRPHVMKMFRGAEQDVAMRTFQTLMGISEDHYAMTAREQDMAEMDKLFSPREIRWKRCKLSGHGLILNYQIWKAVRQR